MNKENNRDPLDVLIDFISSFKQFLQYYIKIEKEVSEKYNRSLQEFLQGYFSPQTISKLVSEGKISVETLGRLFKIMLLITDIGQKLKIFQKLSIKEKEELIEKMDMLVKDLIQIRSDFESVGEESNAEK